MFFQLLEIIEKKLIIIIIIIKKKKFAAESVGLLLNCIVKKKILFCNTEIVLQEEVGLV